MPICPVLHAWHYIPELYLQSWSGQAVIPLQKRMKAQFRSKAQEFDPFCLFGSSSIHPTIWGVAGRGGCALLYEIHEASQTLASYKTPT